MLVFTGCGKNEPIDEAKAAGWECEADDAIAELEKEQGRPFTEKEKAIFRKRGEHRFKIPEGVRWSCWPPPQTSVKY